nr:type I restriction endonuclease subunit R [Leptolyngbya sp. FACHB-16]
MTIEPALALLQNLGYCYLSHSEISPLRENPRSGILVKQLRDSLQRLNPWISADNLNRAIRAVTRINTTDLLEANERAYEMLTRGTTVLQDLGSGSVNHTVRFIDFDQPEANTYTVTQEFRVQRSQAGSAAWSELEAEESDESSRTYISLDLVLFVNGLPLALIECKSPFRRDPIGDAIEQLRCYQELEDHWQGHGAPQIMSTVQILIATCQQKAVFGSIGNAAYAFVPFPQPYPMDEARFTRFLMREPNAQDVLIYSLLEPKNLLEYTRNLVAFETVQGRTVKKLARHHQRIAIDQAIQRILQNSVPLERGGVIWHTQGSGKSLTMVWLAQKLRQASLGLGNPTLIILTDRVELDVQITSIFHRVGFLNPQRAESVRHLRELLKIGQGMTILTTLQKLYAATRDQAELSVADNVFVIVDEAHRTQHGSMAARMRSALPNATYLAFTSTPIDKKDRSTLKLFGSYIHKYTMQDAVRNGTTVPIFYETRKVYWVEEQVDILFESDFGDDRSEERDLIRRRYATVEAIATSSQRIAEISLDLVQHFKQYIQPNGFKGQIVAVNRDAAVRYKHELDKLNGPESAVIFTSSANDPEWLLQHRTTPTDRKRLTDRFKDANDSLSLLIVVDMLLTGFDAPIEQVMYLDAPLKEHTLLQAIARVNLPYKGKDAGFIVDYWGISENLPKALKLFDLTELGTPMMQKHDEVPILEIHHRSVLRFFTGINRTDYEAMLRAIKPEDVRARFDQAYRAFVKSMNLLLPDPEALRFQDDLKWLSRIREAARTRFRDYDLNWNEIPRKVRQLIDDSIRVSGIEQTIEPVATSGLRYDQELENLSSTDAKASEAVNAIRYEITRRESENPTFYRSLEERLEKIIQERRRQRLSDIEQLQLLSRLKEDLLTGPTKAASHLGLTETSFAFFQLLEQRINKDIAIDLAREIESILKDLVVVDWVVKEDVQWRMRKQLRRSLLAKGLTRDEAEPTIHELMDIARAKMAQ